MKGPKLSYRYDHYTWPELKDLIPKQPVVVLPVGSTEDHGHHLPLDVDTFVVSSICDAAAQRITNSGVIGDATLGTVEKGERFFNGAAESLAEIIREFRAMPIEPRVDRHE